ncbi:hypothetical protein HBN50_17440 [Halobacteriovorax sp. GB3]|uniref:hypothetical protein n=1 Tax=Halobacteriovorax sp. GB3 TaxID=2719615 RepID=UPI00235E561F|nr:hypothetical protein [Halobacteriovorax sp. GB3]MDD0854888.1 hypothetical protein [Halobacteriovorax sp. GB3]
MKKQAILLGSFVLLASIFPLNSSAAESCNEVKECLDLASKLTGKSYTTTIKLQGGVTNSDDLKWNQSNADKLITSLLFESNLIRVPIDEKTYKIVESRDVRYQSLPIMNVNTKSDSTGIPKTHDFFMASYTLTHPNSGALIARALRPFISRYGRIIESKLASTLIIQDTGLNINRLHTLIGKLDVKPSKEALRELKEKKNKEK